MADKEEQVVLCLGDGGLGDVLDGQVPTGGWEEPYVVVASMLLDVSVAMADFKHIFVPFRNQIQPPCLVNVILALEDAFEGERILVHRPLKIRHLTLFFVGIQYSDPGLCLRLEAKNSQSTHLQLTYTNLPYIYSARRNSTGTFLYDASTTLLSITTIVYS